ncbi:MAG TPA: carboxypeptidase-like regulatory domain-containing protein, partial [Chitinophagaceae bacterium]|nr:carboxypeptidase-like regulatory domain-containing protein [Chitinophagaceae bacterium]
MKRTLLFLTLLITAGASAQDSYIISGKIADSLNKENLEGASVTIKGTKNGTVTRHDGTFEIKTSAKLPLVLIISSIGYKTQEFLVDNNTKGISINLHSDNLLIEQVVVSASRIRESILRSPVSIEKLDVRAIRQTTAPTFFDALENVKGVQMTTLSMGYKVPNTRGFSGTTNSRFL